MWFCSRASQFTIKVVWPNHWKLYFHQYSNTFTWCSSLLSQSKLIFECHIRVAWIPVFIGIRTIVCCSSQWRIGLRFYKSVGSWFFLIVFELDRFYFPMAQLSWTTKVVFSNLNFLRVKKTVRTNIGYLNRQGQYTRNRSSTLSYQDQYFQQWKATQEQFSFLIWLIRN